MGSKHRGSESEVGALSAFINLVRASESVTTRSHGHLAEEGLSGSEFGVMETLFHCGTLSQGELAGKLLRACGTVTATVDRLEKRKLVARKRSLEDRRSVHVQLTEKGREIVGRIFPNHARAIAKEFAVLTAAEQKQLRRLCRKLGTKRG